MLSHSLRQTVELINQTVDVGAQMPVIRTILPHVIGTLPLFEKAVKEEDDEMCQGASEWRFSRALMIDLFAGLCVIFSEAADIWIPLIQEADKDALPLLDLLLACLSHPDWEVAQISLR
jgi:hypothetical protein